VWAIVSYFALLIGLAASGAVLLRIGAAAFVQAQGWGVGAWLCAAIALAAILSGVSLIIYGTEDANDVSHYSGTAVGNSVSLSAVTNGESAWKWRTGLIFIFMICAEYWLERLLGPIPGDLTRVFG
jgi:hypothetical protein